MHELPARIRQLIEREGSITSIAERCGFSAGAVRSWRDGNSDISRGRCITLARTLNVSLLWLTVGEGSMEVERGHSTLSGIHRTRPVDSPRVTGLDPARLAMTLRLLQSYVVLAGGSLDPTSRADLLAELYDILGQIDDIAHTDRLIRFHEALRRQLQCHRQETAVRSDSLNHGANGDDNAATAHYRHMLAHHLSRRFPILSGVFP